MGEPHGIALASGHGDAGHISGDDAAVAPTPRTPGVPPCVAYRHHRPRIPSAAPFGAERNVSAATPRTTVRLRPPETSERSKADPAAAQPQLQGLASFPGRVAERTKATVLKTVRGESPSRVRIPVLPLPGRSARLTGGVRSDR
jgi:hypothetical protein